MEVRNLIKTSAKIVQVAEVNVGDVYKRLQENAYSDPKVVYGVVTDILNNGEQSSLVTLEFVPAAYDTNIQAQTRVFPSGTEVALFPATVDEYRAALLEAIDAQSRVVEKANTEFIAKNAVLNRMIAQSNEALSAALVQEIQ